MDVLEVFFPTGSSHFGSRLRVACAHRVCDSFMSQVRRIIVMIRRGWSAIPALNLVRCHSRITTSVGAAGKGNASVPKRRKVSAHDRVARLEQAIADSSKGQRRTEPFDFERAAEVQRLEKSEIPHAPSRAARSIIVPVDANAGHFFPVRCCHAAGSVRQPTLETDEEEKCFER